MTTNAFVEDVMLADVERIADSTSEDLERVLLWKSYTTGDLLHLMRQPYQDPGVTVDDLACAIDAIDSLARARAWEIADELMNGWHWAGNPGCPGCRPVNDEAGPATP